MTDTATSYGDLRALVINWVCRSRYSGRWTSTSRPASGGIPANGNQRSEWDAGSRFDFENPEHR